ncbi:hypothetical protein [Thermococcus sp. 9N3]|uniref:hypothetical protein n=1 Tax=Thermococcus sp. 9N3 TaxID=163002 RepID=UPI001430CB55|nr:hypothetical protein [Thermococcus sp. 9N3]NJE50070.1 hypothetical protein [Thermococcus sp. 9N3]
MSDEVIRSIQSLLEGLVNEANVHRRLVLEGAILDLFEVVLIKHELKLPVVIGTSGKRQRLTKREDVEKIITWLKKVVSSSAREVDNPMPNDGLIRYRKTAFRNTLLVQGILIQLLEQGIFGEQSMFKLSVRLPGQEPEKAEKGAGHN